MSFSKRRRTNRHILLKVDVFAPAGEECYYVLMPKMSYKEASRHIIALKQASKYDCEINMIDNLIEVRDEKRC